MASATKTQRDPFMNSIEEIDSHKREMNLLPKNIIKSINELNRVFNYVGSYHSAAIYGEEGVGKTLVLHQFAHHLKELPSLNTNRTVMFLNMNNIPESSDTGDEQDALDALIDDINDRSMETRLIVVVDDFHLATHLMKSCHQTSFVVELGEEDFNHAMMEHESELNKFDGVEVEASVEWCQLLREMEIRNAEYAKKSGSDLIPPSSVKAFSSELVSQIYPSSGSSFDKRENIDVSVGYMNDQLEWLYARSIEPPYAGRRITPSIARKLAAEAFESNLYVSNQGFDDDDPLMALFSDNKKPAQNNKKPKEATLKYKHPESLNKRLNKEIINQNSAVSLVANSILIDAAKLKPKNHPVASFLFIGPSGVGKTQLAKSLATELFEKPVNLVRIDCSELSEKHTASRIFGAPPGYVGFDEGGELTNAVREHPQSIVLLDEVEKAHRDIWNTFLQVFDDARLTDGQGVVTDFSQCIFIMTGNLGSRDAQSHKSVGFGKSKSSDTDAIYMKATRDFFRPEFLNRLDAICVFNDLNRNDYRKIVALKLQQIEKTISSNYRHKVTFDLSNDALDIILDKAETENHGAREVDRVLKKDVILPLAGRIVEGDIIISKSDSIRIFADKGKIELEV